MTSRLGDLLTARDWWDGLWGVMTAEQVTMVVLGASGGCLYYKCFFPDESWEKMVVWVEYH